ncbi:MAG: hypothetical protein DRN29_07425, partial [Thermoplasmata archaeon]
MRYFEGGRKMRNSICERECSLKRIGEAIFVTLILVITVFYPVTINVSSTTIGGHDITFISHTYDATTDISTWTYRVTSGSSPSISHWIMELGACIKKDDIVEVSEDYEFKDILHPDPTTGLTGIKFEKDYGNGENRIVWFKLRGDYSEGLVQVAIKAGGSESYGYVIGPSCWRPDIRIEKTVWNDISNTWENSVTANIGDIIKFNISVYNSGTENLTDVNITDYLPKCLQYAGNAIVNGVPLKPTLWGNNLTWLLSYLPPCSWVYIEFDAIVIPEIALPNDRISMKVFTDSNSYFDTHLYDIPSGYDITDGWYVGWCADYWEDIHTGRKYDTMLYSSYDPYLFEKCPSAYDEDWDKVNYIINHKQGDKDDIQDAIWYFVGREGHWPSDPDAQAMIIDALANGEGYVPPIGGIMAVICYVRDNIQLTFVELEVTPNDGVNINKANVTAVGLYTGKTVYDEDDAFVNKKAADLTVEKYVSKDNGTWKKSIFAYLGDTIYWKITVTNSGMEDLSNIYVNDSVKSYGPFDLAVGASRTFYYETIASDINNTATAEGKDSDGNKVTDSD